MERQEGDPITGTTVMVPRNYEHKTVAYPASKNTPLPARNHARTAL